MMPSQRLDIDETVYSHRSDPVRPDLPRPVTATADRAHAVRSRPTRRATATGSSADPRRRRRDADDGRAAEARRARRATSSSSTATTSASTSSSPTRSSACASSTPRCAASCSPARSTASSAPARTSSCSRTSTHAFKVNFCKFTNETRLSSRTRARTRGLQLRSPRSTARPRGGGYELALACDEILLVDDGNSAVSLPRGAAARRAARHRRPHAPRRQAQGPPRPRRRVLHARRGHQGQARGRVEPRRRARAARASCDEVVARRARELAAGRRP